jgi:hypothetical protein
MGNALERHPDGQRDEKSLAANTPCTLISDGSLFGTEHERGTRGTASDIYVRTSLGEVGIYHPAMLRQFNSQRAQRPVGSRINNDMRDDLDFCAFVDQRLAQASEEVFRLLGKVPPEHKQESEALLRDISQRARHDARSSDLSAEATTDYVNQQIFRAMSDKYQGTALGNRAAEACTLGSYSRDALNHSAAKCGLPLPGQSNPCNDSGREYYHHTPQIMESYIRAQFQRQQIVQFLNMMSLFSNCGMGMFPFMASSWVR